MRIVGDDRARICASIVMAGKQPSVGAGVRPLLARLHMMDEWGEGWPYDEAFSSNELQAGYYTRYANLGSHYVASDHAFCFLGFGDYPLKPIHNNHMQELYKPIFWLIPFYSAMYDSLSRRIHEALQKTTPNKSAIDFTSLKEKLTRFRATLLYDRVSSQVQGRDLFALMYGSPPAADEIKQLEDQMSHMESYYSNQRDIAAENRIRFLTSTGVVLVLFSAMKILLSLDWPLPLSASLLLDQWQNSIAAILTIVSWGALWYVDIRKPPESSTKGRFSAWLRLFLF